MRFADPLSLKARTTRVSTLFAASQFQGKRPSQEDYFYNFNDECFAIADGVSGLPNGGEAAKLACETATWAYRHVRLRPFYWDDKKLFLKRIFRTTNITLFQKRKEPGFEEGLATTLAVCILGEKSFWVGGVGDSRVYQLTTNGILTQLLPDDMDLSGKLTKVVGGTRYGLVPHVVARTFIEGETILMATDGVWRYVEEHILADKLIHSGQTTKSLSNAVDSILASAKKNGSTDNMTAILIKRVTS